MHTQNAYKEKMEQKVKRVLHLDTRFSQHGVPKETWLLGVCGYMDMQQSVFQLDVYGLIVLEDLLVTGFLEERSCWRAWQEECSVWARSLECTMLWLLTMQPAVCFPAWWVCCLVNTGLVAWIMSYLSPE